MKRFVAAALLLFASSTSAYAFDDASYTCGYFVCVPGLDTIYFAKNGNWARDTYEDAVALCKYNRGGRFGVEVCEDVACVRNSKNGSRCKNAFVPN